MNVKRIKKSFRKLPTTTAMRSFRRKLKAGANRRNRRRARVALHLGHVPEVPARISEREVI